MTSPKLQSTNDGTLFQTQATQTERFGENSYLELATKTLTESNGTRSEFLILTRGFIQQDGEKRWTKYVTMPRDLELCERLSAWFNEEARNIREEHVTARCDKCNKNFKATGLARGETMPHDGCGGQIKLKEASA